MLRSDPAQAAKTQRQRKCLHEHWKSCYDYPEAHTWESRTKEDIEEKEAVRALVAAEDDSYLAYDEACKVRQFTQWTRLQTESEEDSLELKMSSALCDPHSNQEEVTSNAKEKTVACETLVKYNATTAEKWGTSAETVANQNKANDRNK
ncbi:hypothetical protein EI94DRAFT_1813223 [Lactarius quietus]|nr:hypothetical protein EI94DRAFT_1813223 [Lactarius quietus]